MSIPRCGDHVHHRPSDEKWVVAYADDKRDELAWAGWPDGIAKLSDCDVVYRCTEEEHRDAVDGWIKSGQGFRRSNVLRMYSNLPE